MSTPSRFHELFVGHAMQLAGDYDKRIGSLEYEIKRLKMVIENLAIECDPDIQVPHNGFGYGDSDVIASIDCELFINTNDAVQEYMDIDGTYICDECTQLCVINQHKLCPVVSIKK